MKDNNGDKINFANHEEFCKKLIEEAGKRGMHLINMDGVFDLVLNSRRPKLIEVKMIKRDFRIGVGDNYGFEFDKNQTAELRGIDKKGGPQLIPVVISCDKAKKDEKRFYFSSSEQVREHMHKRNRDEFAKIIFNRLPPDDHLFLEPMT